MSTRPVKWIGVLEDAGDGSGDLVLELPEDLLEAAGIKIGDTLDCEVIGKTII